MNDGIIKLNNIWYQYGYLLVWMIEDCIRLKEDWKYIDFYQIVRYTIRNYIFEGECIRFPIDGKLLRW